MLQMRKSFALFVLVWMLALAAGCGANNNEDVNQGTNAAEGQAADAGQHAGDDQDSQASEGTAGETSAFPATFTDGSGKEITIEEQPQTIVSLQASNTEIAFALGLGDKIIGVSDYCNYPEAALEKEKLGGQEMNVERILELQPDMLLVSPFHNETHSDVLQTFKDAGIDVVVAGDASSFADTYETIRMFGQATGTADKAEAIVANMQERLEAVKEKAQQVQSQKRVWIEVSPAPDIFTTGKGTFMNEMLEAIQAVNVAGDQTGWVKLNEEEIVALDPDVIITTYGYYIDNAPEQVYTREGWSEVPAVVNQQVFDVDSDMVTRPGPRLIDGVEDLARHVYPDIFQP